MDKLIRSSEYVPHPKFTGVFVKHFFSSADNDRLNNCETRIDPAFQITPHIHENAIEFFYVIKGTGKFLFNGEWIDVQPGDALKAPIGIEHGFDNTSEEPLFLLTTFSPPIR